MLEISVVPIYFNLNKWEFMYIFKIFSNFMLFLYKNKITNKKITNSFVEIHKNTRKKENWRATENDHHNIIGSESDEEKKNVLYTNTF